MLVCGQTGVIIPDTSRRAWNERINPSKKLLWFLGSRTMNCASKAFTSLQWVLWKKTCVTRQWNIRRIPSDRNELICRSVVFTWTATPNISDLFAYSVPQHWYPIDCSDRLGSFFPVKSTVCWGHKMHWQTNMTILTVNVKHNRAFHD